MKTLVLTTVIGILAGVVDILPMIKMRLDKSAILSAFVFYLMMPFVIYNTKLFNGIWGLKGAIITLMLATPIMIIVGKDDKKSVIPMVVMAIVIGTLIGIVGHVLKIS